MTLTASTLPAALITNLPTVRGTGLDGTAHTWHHPFRALATQIKFGTPGGQGNMPGFAEKLTDEQIVNVIAWLQARWPDETYARWLEIQERTRASSQ